MLCRDQSGTDDPLTYESTFLRMTLGGELAEGHRSDHNMQIDAVKLSVSNIIQAKRQLPRFAEPVFFGTGMKATGTPLSLSMGVCRKND